MNGHLFRCYHSFMHRNTHTVYKMIAVRLYKYL